MRLQKIILAALIMAACAGCSKSKEAAPVCSYDPCAFVVPASEIQSVKKYLDSTGTTATQHCSGMFYAISNAGTGKQPAACSNVIVQYKGQFTNGTVFDQSTNPVAFNLESLIGGWKNGIPLLREGGSIRLFVPPSLAYGDTDYKNVYTGKVIIPANSVLVFDVNLVAVY